MQMYYLSVIVFFKYVFERFGRKKLFLVYLSSQVAYRIFAIIYGHQRISLYGYFESLFYIRSCESLSDNKNNKYLFKKK